MFRSLQPLISILVLILTNSILLHAEGNDDKGSADEPLPLANSIVNSEFDQGTTGWQLGDWSGAGYTSGGNSMSVVTSAGLSGTNALYINIVNASNESWTIQPKQILNFSLEVGKTYAISFMAKGETSRTMTAALRGEGSDVDYWSNEVNLTTNAQTFSFEYTCTNQAVGSEPDFSIAFYLAKGIISDVWIDKVIVEDITANTAVTGVTVSPSTLEMSVQQSAQLTESVVPFNATNKNVSWTSTHPSIANVSNTGLVTAVAPGTTTITVTTQDGSFTATSTITVQATNNGIVNGEFDQGTTNWALGDWTGPNYSNGGNSFSSVANASMSGQNALYVDVVNNNSDNWTLQVRQVLNFRIEVGKTYNITFSAKAQSNRTMGVAIHGETSDTDPWATDVNLTTSTQNFSFQYTCNDPAVDNEAAFAFAFFLARGVISDVWIDNVVVQDVSLSIPVTGIAVLPESLSLPIGQTTQLTATLAPLNSTNQGVTWSSGSNGVATVSNTGVITAMGIGTATITAESVDGNFTDTAVITVVPASNNVVLNPEFDQGTANWFFGDWSGQDYANGGNIFTVVNNAAMSGANALHVEIVNTNSSNWTIQPKQTLPIDLQVGKTYSISFMAKAETNRTIDAALRGENTNLDFWVETVSLTTTPQTFNFEYTCTDQNVNNETEFAVAFYLAKGVLSDVWIDRIVIEDITSGPVVTGVNLSHSTLNLALGSSWQLNPLISPSNAANKNVTWNSSNPAIATVSNTGLVTPVAEGTATITVTTVDGSFADVCTVTVKHYNSEEGILELFAFQYKYDGRKRMTHKKVPGAEWIFMIYDDRDRLVLTQDGEQRNRNQWTFTKYDHLNRPVSTGIWTDTQNRGHTDLQLAVNNFYATDPNNPNRWFEERDSVSGNVHGFTNRTFPDVSTETDFLTVTYYDDYSFESLLGANATSFSYDASQLPASDGIPGQRSNYFERVKGQVTGSKTKNLDNNEFLWSVVYYDDRYRAVQTIASNHKGGIDKTTNVYDFVGKLLRTKTSHTAGPNSQAIATIRTFNYDHAGRLEQVHHKTGNANPVVLVENEYNEIGQLVTKKMHSENNEPFKQQVDYRYNIRGWLTRINDSNLSTSDGGPKDYFGMELGYDDGLGITSAGQYNGNISAIKWSSNLGLGFNDSQLEIFEPTARGYAFTYDAMNRLKTSAHFEKTTTWNASPNFHENVPQYDLNGNIERLTRKGKIGNNMDVLEYTYEGNRLRKVEDTGNDQEGFKDGNITGDDYLYDENGNMITDKNKSIETIEYNYLNLPYKVTKTDGQYVKYIYNASGLKMSQEVYDASSVLKKKTDYLGEFFYENDTLKFINHEEGRIVMTGTTPEYQYTLKDHLGNTRITFTSKNEPEIFTATMDEGKQEDEQDVFGSYNSYINEPLDPTPAENAGDRILILNGSTLEGSNNGQVGLTKSFGVMPGDIITATVNAKYSETTSGAGNIAGFAAALTQAFGLMPSPAPLEGISPYEALNAFGSIIATGGRDGDELLPQGYLNILVFDTEHNLVDMAFEQVGTSLTLSASLEIRQAGIVYVFLSNDGVTQQQIGFDNYELTHEKSAVVQADDYYPFGLTFNSYSRENSVPNKYKFGGKEEQTELALNTIDWGWRQYDPAIGRWNVIDQWAEKYNTTSPYAFVSNNPISNREIDGRYYDDKNEKKAQRYENKLDKRIGKLEKQVAKLEAKGKDVGDRKERISEMKQSKADFSDMRQSTTEFRFAGLNNKFNQARDSQGRGLPATIRTGQNQVTMFMPKTNFHEPRHGGQIARGEYNVDVLGRTSPSYGANEEISAYRAEYAYSGKIEYKPGLDLTNVQDILKIGTQKTIDNINQITPAFLKELVDTPGVNQEYIYKDRPASWWSN